LYHIIDLLTLTFTHTLQFSFRSSVPRKDRKIENTIIVKMSRSKHWVHFTEIHKLNKLHFQQVDERLKTRAVHLGPPTWLSIKKPSTTTTTGENYLKTFRQHCRTLDENVAKALAFDMDNEQRERGPTEWSTDKSTHTIWF